MNSTLYWIGIALIIVLASARLTRLAVYDDFPPVKVVRDVFKVWLEDSDWGLLAECGYCASFWVTLAVVLSGYYSDFHIAWVLVCGTLAASYLAATYVANDGDSTEDEDEDEETYL